MTVSDDETHMRRAIGLAQARVGQTAENPAVGCVIVADGQVAGEGATGEGGRPHAEEVALALAGESARGATAYVTLEPCAERSSGAASCSERLASSGVARVVVACRDASPYASGGGLERLRGEGLAVEVGVLADEAAALYQEYQPHTIVRPRR